MKNPLLHIHERPLTRRDFIARGMIAGGATVLTPTIFGLMNAEASPFPLKTNRKKMAGVPFVTFDLAGGAALAGNFLVGGTGGAKDFLPSYSMLGFNGKTAKLDERFGAPMAPAEISQMLAGMLQVMTPEAQTTFRFGTLCHTGQIDTSSNPLSAVSLATHSGTKGSEISSPVGLRNSLSGGNSRYALEDASYKAMSVGKLDDLLSAVGLGGTMNGIPDSAKDYLGRLVNRLSMAQAKRVLNSSADEETLKNLGVKYQGAAAKVKASSGLDPRRDPIFSQIYGINQNTDPNSMPVLRGAVMMGVLKGVTGPGVITIDGCDYHDSSQTTGDTKDLEIGIEIGRAIEAAHRLQTPLFIQIITDGGIYPREGSRVWLGDSIDTCMSIVGFYQPKKPLSYFDSRMQVGSYTSGQGADRSHLIGDSPQLAAYAAFANYLSVSGRINEFQRLAPGIFSDADLQKVLMFQA